jgi:hypothetical protein
MESFSFKGGRKLDDQSDELCEIKYHLNLVTNGKFDYSLFELWKIENLDLSLQFQRDYPENLKVLCWFKAADLGYDNNIELVSKRGFFIPPNGGIKCTTGRIDLKAIIRNGKPVDCLLILCEVAVGRAKVVDQVSLNDDLPEQYESFYCPPQALDRNNDGQFSFEEYSMTANFDKRSPL